MAQSFIDTLRSVPPEYLSQLSYRGRMLGRLPGPLSQAGSMFGKHISLAVANVELRPYAHEAQWEISGGGIILMNRVSLKKAGALLFEEQILGPEGPTTTDYAAAELFMAALCVDRPLVFRGPLAAVKKGGGIIPAYGLVLQVNGLPLSFAWVPGDKPDLQREPSVPALGLGLSLALGFWERSVCPMAEGDTIYTGWSALSPPWFIGSGDMWLPVTLSEGASGKVEKYL